MRRPRFIAEQARHAQGPLGRLIAAIMVRETETHNERAIQALDVKDGDHVIDIGCGPGGSLAQLARRSPKGRVVGADPSELMARAATRRNRAQVNSGRVEVVVASAEALPFPNDSFDKAVSVHVLYFWADLEASLGELARVLKPGGRLALLFRSAEDVAAVRAFPPDVYRFRSVGEVRDALRRAGFATTETSSGDVDGRPAPNLVLATKGAR